MIKAIFPGSFDPPTNGHLNLIERAAKLYDELHIIVAVNSEKSSYFSADQRVGLLNEMSSGMGNVKVASWDRLIVDYVRQEGIDVLLRGVRAVSDFGYEFELAMIYKQLEPRLEVVFMPTDPRFLVVRSSVVKEIANYDGAVKGMVPEVVFKALMEKIHGA
jgi:pantetheine-phosphate adenylyltransferase